MVERSTNEVSQLLNSWSAGDEQALEKLVPLVYRELHRRPGDTWPPKGRAILFKLRL
jgi:hypothetical protein